MALWLASAFFCFLGCGCRCSGTVDEAWFADTFAFDGLHKSSHVDVELVATLVRWLTDWVDSTCSDCIPALVARHLDNIGGRLLGRVVVLLVVFLWFFKFAGFGFAILFAIAGGFSHARDLGPEDHVLVLPFDHGLLGMECGVVKGIVGE